MLTSADWKAWQEISHSIGYLRNFTSLGCFFALGFVWFRRARSHSRCCCCWSLRFSLQCKTLGIRFCDKPQPFVCSPSASPLERIQSCLLSTRRSRMTNNIWEKWVWSFEHTCKLSYHHGRIWQSESAIFWRSKLFCQTIHLISRALMNLYKT